MEDIADWTPSDPPDGHKDENEDESEYEEREEQQEEEEEYDELDSVQVSERAKKRRKLEKEDIARLNLLVPNVDLATGCSPNHLPGGPPSAQAQVLSQRILALLHTADIIPLSKLRIWNNPPTNSSSSGANAEVKEELEQEGLGKKEVKAFWVLYIDILFLSLDGTPLDSAWLAMLAALRDAKLPHAAWDAERQGVVCDPDLGVARGLGLRDLPIALTCGVFVEEGESAVGRRERRKWILTDMDGFEEGLCRETVTVVVGRRGRLLRIEKGGGGGVNGQEIKGIITRAEKWRGQCIGILQS